MKVAIQTTGEGGPRQNAVLDHLAKAAKELGHGVARWFYLDSIHKPCEAADVVIMWNGQYKWSGMMRQYYPGQRFFFCRARVAAAATMLADG